MTPTLPSGSVRPCGVRFVPVESVYAVFEVKPEFNMYVSPGRLWPKVASVRGLKKNIAGESCTRAGKVCRG